MGKILCWFGIHKYEMVDHGNFGRYECKRCHEPKWEKF